MYFAFSRGLPAYFVFHLYRNVYFSRRRAWFNKPATKITVLALQDLMRVFRRFADSPVANERAFLD